MSQKNTANNSTLALGLVLSLVLFVSMQVVAPALAQPSSVYLPHNTLSGDIAALESQLKTNAEGKGTLSERLCNLETLVFGKPQTGTLFERTELLKNKLANEPSPVNNAQPDQATVVQEQYPEKNQLNIAQIIACLPLVNESQVNFVRLQPAGTTPEIPPDYLDAIMRESENRVIRFKKMPIPIFIAPYNDPDFTRACIRGFEDWEEGTHGAVRFDQVDDPNRARIRVIWSHLGIAQQANSCTLGAHTVTKWKVSSGNSWSGSFWGNIPISGMQRVDVPPQIIEVNLDLIYAKPERIRIRILENIIAHELGHALGLVGHSPLISDLMYAFTDECSRLSSRDINTLERLYQLPVDIPL